MKVLDLSHWNLVTDWNRVSADAVIIKATQGTTFVDPKFKEYQAEARKRFLCGFYHFASGTDPVKEADFFVKTVGDLREGELLALDWEIPHADPVGWSLAFLRRVEEKVGFKPLFYTNEARVKQYNWKPVVDGSYGLWVAKYSWFSPAIGAWPFYVLWQYTSKASMPGISGTVDLSKGSLSLDTLKKYGKPHVEECKHCLIHCPK